MATHTKFVPYAMSEWKRSAIQKGARASRTRSGFGATYIPKPPVDGWPPFTGNYSDYGVRMARK